MKRLLIVILSLYLLACNKLVNQLDNPEYRTIEAHSWQSDSLNSRANGVSTVSYSSAGNYEVFHINYPEGAFVRYENGQIADSTSYFLSYQPGVLRFLPDTSGEIHFLNYANIKAATDNRLVLERHTSADSSVPVVTTYYHTQ